ncbi:MAG TPA: tyrosine-type recombinase/integrase [Gemmatimonadaceae bacterium]|nr:tyrosine-type recombinase/integrase [Gemmatimonadaceae bacterium]
MRVRLFQKRKDGPFYRAVWLSGEGINQRPLGTKDKDEALRLGKLLLSELLKGEKASTQLKTLMLGQLWKLFSTECVEFLDNKARTRKDANARAKVLLAYFGEQFPVADLTVDDQRRYEQARLAGGIEVTPGEKTRKSRARTPEADMVLLHAMLRWGTTKRLPDGRYLLDRNPLQNVRRLREKNKKQERATWERFEATMAAMKRLQVEAEEAEDDAARVRWIRMRFALFLAEATGRRLGSIRQLRWEDFQYDRGVLYWRAEADKKGYNWEIPMPPPFMETARAFQRELGAITGSVFAAEKADDGIMDRHLFDKWLTVAERTAGLRKLDGAMWHAYRRKWATERKHLNPKDVAAAGGWKDVATLLEVYQQSDEASVLAVMSEPKKLRERGVA